MVEDNIEDIRKNVISEIKEKIKRLKLEDRIYVHPCNKEFQDDIKRLKFDNDNKFVYWMQQNGILKRPIDIDRDVHKKTLEKAGCKNDSEYYYEYLEYEKHPRDGKKISYEKLVELAKKDGFYNLSEWNKWKREYGKWYKELEDKYGKEFVEWVIQNRGKIPDKWLNLGCKTGKEYLDKLAQNKGYHDRAERCRYYRYNTGRSSPSSQNEDCADSFGIDIGEELFRRFLLTIFEYVEHMKRGNRGFDFICKNPRQEFIDKYHQFKFEKDKEYRIQHKARCIRYDTNSDEWSGWHYSISDRNGYNNNTDYFILSAWDDRDNLNILHIWIFYKNDMVRGEKFWKRKGFVITNTPKKLKEFQNYELTDELAILRELYKKLKEEI